MKQPSHASPAALDIPKFRVTFLPEPHSNGSSATALDNQAAAIDAAHAFGCLEAAAAGIGQVHETLAEPLSGLTSGSSSLACSPDLAIQLLAQESTRKDGREAA